MIAKFRQTLRDCAELADNEEQTASVVAAFLERLEPTELWRGVGGHGVVALFRGQDSGPCILLRCELDALPEFSGQQPRRAAHRCGHDGHMAILAGLGVEMAKRRHKRGTIALLFQPAEETGQGAKRVIADPRYQKLRPDLAFALHNIPGRPMGRLLLKSGITASASQGMKIILSGVSSHASEPHLGRSPIMAVAELIPALMSAPSFAAPFHQPALVTVVHTKVGEPSFGTSPGEAIVLATLRTHDDSVMKSLRASCELRARHIAEAWGLQLQVEMTESFPTTCNSKEALQLAERAAVELSLDMEHMSLPFSWSEDFGHICAATNGALLGLGAGDCLPLHHPRYDFPEELLPVGIKLLDRICRNALESQ